MEGVRCLVGDRFEICTPILSSALLENTRPNLAICDEGIEYCTELLPCARERTGFMTKVIEVLFHHKWRLLVLLALPILVSGAIAFKQPRTYEASAGLWALRRYEIIGATGPEADLTSTPAETQTTTVSEFLQSKSFVLAVAYDTDLPQLLAASNPGPRNCRMLSTLRSRPMFWPHRSPKIS